MFKKEINLPINYMSKQFANIYHQCQSNGRCICVVNVSQWTGSCPLDCCILSLSVAHKGSNNRENKNNKANNNKMTNGKNESSRTFFRATAE
jgi:hypothetical protein